MLEEQLVDNLLGRDEDLAWDTINWLVLADLYEEYNMLLIANWARDMYALSELLLPVWDNLLNCGYDTSVDVQIQQEPYPIIITNRSTVLGIEVKRADNSSHRHRRKLWTWVKGKDLMQRKTTSESKKHIIENLSIILRLVTKTNRLQAKKDSTYATAQQ